jgi:hypothetical protein
MKYSSKGPGCSNLRRKLWTTDFWSNSKPEPLVLRVSSRSSVTEFNSGRAVCFEDIILDFRTAPKDPARS